MGESIAEVAASDRTVILRKPRTIWQGLMGAPTESVITGWRQAEMYLRQGYEVDWLATGHARAAEETRAHQGADHDR